MGFLARTINFIMPPRCIVTGEVVDTQGMLSPLAWQKLNFISDPQCYRCGIPFDFDDGDAKEGHICALCLRQPPLFNQARSALVYDDASRDVILAFKHADQTLAVPSFIPWLNRAGSDILAQADYFIPVPLHRWRILRRRYNQSALIAKYLSDDVKIPCLPDGLVRTRATPVQGHLHADQRKKNVKNAFAMNPKLSITVRDKHIVLIDDVYTTGATVAECTKVLLKAGAIKVDVLTLARVVKPGRG